MHVIVGKVVTFATFLKKYDGEWSQRINSTLSSELSGTAYKCHK